MGIVNNYEQIREKTVAIVGVGGVGSGLYFAVTTFNSIFKTLIIPFHWLCVTSFYWTISVIGPEVEPVTKRPFKFLRKLAKFN